MKIVLISSLYGTHGGGAGVIAERLAQGLLAEGHSVAVITTGHSREPSTVEMGGVRCISFLSPNLYRVQDKDLHPLWQRVIWQSIDVHNPLTKKRLLEILRTEAPDIIHIHKIRGLSGAVWTASTSCLPGRVIQTCHDYESMSPDGLLRGRIGAMALRGYWPIRGYQLLRRNLSAGISFVTAPSLLLLSRIKDSGLFPRAIARVVPNTHGLTAAELRTIHQESNLFFMDHGRFLYLGRLEPEKGVLQLCEAFERAYAKVSTIKLDIAGWGSLEAELRSHYGKHPAIHFLGMIEGETKENALRHATAIVVPSLVDEAFGMVAVEAFAFGRPVIASRVGALPELVRHGTTGWLVEPGNIEAWESHLLFAAGLDNVARKRMSQACQESSFEFAIDTVIKMYLEIYHKLRK